jgi:hypothetical protein
MRSNPLYFPGGVALVLTFCAGLIPSAGAVTINSITTTAITEYASRTSAPGAPLTLISRDFASGVDVDSYASLDPLHTAYQSYSGFNAVRVGVVSANGQPENRFTSSTSYDVNLTTGPQNDLGGYLLFLDYMVLPGAAGLSRFASAGSHAEYSFEIYTVTPSNTNFEMGASGSVEVRKLANGTTAETIDPIFLAAGTQPGSVDMGGILIQTRETLPFFDTAFLGYFGPDEIVDFSYVMSASVSIPGYEVGGWASIGDPFALQADPDTEIAKHFPAGAPPFRIRMEAAAAPIPEPGTWATLAMGLALLGMGVRRQSFTHTHATP